jgi:signal transduction histidine kinase
MAATLAANPDAAPPLSMAAMWSAFRRTFNTRTIAAVFYLTLLLVISRTAITTYGASFESWLFETARFLRQSLVSGLLVLLAVALGDTVATLYRLGRVRAVALTTLCAAVAAAGSMALRVLVAGSPISNMPRDWSYFLGLWVLWTTMGGLGYALIYLGREDARSRALLVESACRRDNLSAQMMQARLSALQAQIEPHFLFNTLANVKRLYETAPGKGREMLASLIAYLRAALPSMRSSGSTLASEVELVRSFLAILRMRMGERLAFAIDIPPQLQPARLPPLILPTLVENAIKHGLAPLPEGGRIEIRAFADGGDGNEGADGKLLRVQVRDTGAGFKASAGSGVGLANTRSRLAALFGDRASLNLAANTPRGVVATVTIPLQLGEEAA